MKFFFISYFLFINLFLLLNSTPEDPELTFEHLYQYGKNEYTNENWGDCVAFLLRAIEDFNYFRDETLWCREKCAPAKQSSINKLDKLDNQDLWLTSRVMFSQAQQALCLLK